MKGMNNCIKTINNEHPTSNAQLAGAVDDWMFGVGYPLAIYRSWMLDVSLSSHA
jgi:hypothetical protein